jgi:hypothetical protein
MPQFTPFYHFNQLFFALGSLLLIVYLVSKFFLPSFLFSEVIKTYIIKLSDKSNK